MDISAIAPGINRVLVQLHPHNSKIKFLDGYLDLDTSYEPQDHISVIGRIVSIGRLIPLKTHINSDVRLDWYPEQVLLPGDIAYFDYHAVLMALGQRGAAELVEGAIDSFFVQDGFIFVFMPYSSVLLSVRSGCFVMPNGFVLVRRLMERPVTDLVVPDYLKNKFSRYRCEVIAAGLPNRSYLDTKYHDVKEELPPESIIIVSDKGLIKLENDMHATLPKDFFVVQRRWIMGLERYGKAVEISGVSPVEK